MPPCARDLEAWLDVSEDRRRGLPQCRTRLDVDRRRALAAPPSPAKVVELPRTRRICRAWGIAATALAACVALYFLPALKLHLQADHLTGVAELREITLEDGSVVALMPAVPLRCATRPPRREVALLAGQAFFQVVSAVDHPFVVVAGDVTVTVTGTAFDVRTLERRAIVAVQSGAVEVATSRGEQTATLKRGERLAIAGSGPFARSEIGPDDIASWRQHRLVVDGDLLSDVIKELDRHHRRHHRVFAIAPWRHGDHGVFDLRRPFEALQAIARSQRASVTDYPLRLRGFGRRGAVAPSIRGPVAPRKNSAAVLKSRHPVRLLWQRMIFIRRDVRPCLPARTIGEFFVAKKRTGSIARTVGVVNIHGGDESLPFSAQTGR